MTSHRGAPTRTQFELVSFLGSEVYAKQRGLLACYLHEGGNQHSSLRTKNKRVCKGANFPDLPFLILKPSNTNNSSDGLGMEPR